MSSSGRSKKAQASRRRANYLEGSQHDEKPGRKAKVTGGVAMEAWKA